MCNIYINTLISHVKYYICKVYNRSSKYNNLDSITMIKYSWLKSVDGPQFIVYLYV